jgi:hypothetical protein
MTGPKTDQPGSVADAIGVATGAAITIICLVATLDALMRSDGTAAVWAIGALSTVSVTVWWYMSRNVLTATLPNADP